VLYHHADPLPESVISGDGLAVRHRAVLDDPHLRHLVAVIIDVGVEVQDVGHERHRSMLTLYHDGVRPARELGLILLVDGGGEADDLNVWEAQHELRHPAIQLASQHMALVDHHHRDVCPEVWVVGEHEAEHPGCYHPEVGLLEIVRAQRVIPVTEDDPTARKFCLELTELFSAQGAGWGHVDAPPVLPEGHEADRSLAGAGGGHHDQVLVALREEALSLSLVVVDLLAGRTSRRVHSLRHLHLLLPRCQVHFFLLLFNSVFSF